MAEAQRVFYAIDEDGNYVEAHVGLDGGVPGEGEDLDVKAGQPIKTSNPGWIAQLERHPRITEKPPKGAKS